MDRFRALRDFYEVVNIPNQVVDGMERFPVFRGGVEEDGGKEEKGKGLGTSIEFRCVFENPLICWLC